MEPAFFSAAHLFYQDRQKSEEEEDLNEEMKGAAYKGILISSTECEFAMARGLHFCKMVGHSSLPVSGATSLGASGTGALAIFLKKAYLLDITTSDYDDEEIESNIAYNCKLNGVSALPHIKHNWGEPFPVRKPDWSLIIASDILLYTKQYENLIKSIKYLLEKYVSDKCEEQVEGPICDGRFLVCQEHEEISKMPVDAMQLVDSVMRSYNGDSHSLQSSNTKDLHKATSCLQGRESQSRPPSRLPEPCFLMSWRRRIPKKDEAYFFEGCKRARLLVQDFGSRVYCFSQSR
ncbi:hypothetical protein O6H91_12G079400 [Diphasiastrum complanatum]|uniref:Uncharacterized protein n=1 Tax=Diphasiastrum complanatum TaxID=34168 RepID=A0ACC2C415_DIPCM|nr:hypothetical protein O6H91_12G079400 [Diphasiastrum complanatum]